jgi:hypothetical protein
LKYYEIICSVGVIGVCSEDGTLQAAQEDHVKAFGRISKEDFERYGDYPWVEPISEPLGRLIPTGRLVYSRIDGISRSVSVTDENGEQKQGLASIAPTSTSAFGEFDNERTCVDCGFPIKDGSNNSSGACDECEHGMESGE